MKGFKGSGELECLRRFAVPNQILSKVSATVFSGVSEFSQLGKKDTATAPDYVGGRLHNVSF